MELFQLTRRSVLAIGLAAQDTLANLFGAVAVFVDKPFKIGDRVRIGEVDGTVEEMGVRSTRIRSLEGFVITVPNKQLKLKPGMTANVKIEIAKRTNSLRIANAALRFRPTTEMFAAFNQTPPPEMTGFGVSRSGR